MTRREKNEFIAKSVYHIDDSLLKLWREVSTHHSAYVSRFDQLKDYVGILEEAEKILTTFKDPGIADEIL